MQSMTGYGRALISDDDWELKVELRSVNNKGLELYMHIPSLIYPVESNIRNYLKGRLHRGSVNVHIYLKNMGEEQISLDEAKLKAAYLKFTNIKNDLDKISKDDVTSCTTDSIDLVALARLYNVIETKDMIDDDTMQHLYSDLIEPALVEATDKLIQMERKEGDVLCEDFLKRLVTIKEASEKIEELAKTMVADYEAKLSERIKCSLGENYDIVADYIKSHRLAAELAIFADKVDITEEVVRLQSHISQMKQLCTSTEDVKGKKMGFILQEMNRELNTMGSKATSSDIKTHVIMCKAEVEKMREQSLNIQ